MARATSLYVCQSCGAQSRQFFGRCSGCGNWNTLVEQKAAPAADNRRRRPAVEAAEAAGQPRRSEPIQAVGERPLQRLSSGYGELDRVLGGGLVPGSLVLLGGDPGIGKSTLLLQSCRSMAGRTSVLYVSAEESAQQVKLRWRRLAEVAGADGSGPDCPGAEAQNLGADFQLLAETDLELVLQELEALRPAVAIIDSIQALHDGELSSAPGSVAQVRECAAALARIAKRQDTALLLVGGLVVVQQTIQKLLELTNSGYFRRLRERRYRQQLKRTMNQHVILCGYGRIGREIAEQLSGEGVQLLVVENDPDRIEEAQQRGFTVLQGDATLDETLEEAGIHQCRALVAALPSNAANLYVILSARGLAPRTRLIARADSEEAEGKLRLAGADQVVSPYVAGGRTMAATADVIFS